MDTSFFGRNYFITCLFLVTVGLSLYALFSPSKPKPEHVTLSSDQWVCVDSRPSALHADCVQYIRKSIK